MTDLTLLLENMRHVLPPVCVAVVGGNVDKWPKFLHEWDVPAAYFIEADEAQFQRTQSRLNERGAWHACQALLWREAGEIEFYEASNPAENSVLSPDVLNAIWPNLKTRHQMRRHAITLDAVLNGGGRSAPPNWLVVDCLPAMPIIEGARTWLNSFEVVIARVVLDDNIVPTTGATQVELDDFLCGRGFRRIFVNEERHPKVGSAVYIRDAKARLKELADGKRCSDNLAEELERQLESARREKTKHDELLQSCRQEILALTVERDAHALLLAEKDKQITHLNEAIARERNAHDRLITEKDRKSALQIQAIAEQREAFLAQLVPAMSEQVGMLKDQLQSHADKTESELKVQSDSLLRIRKALGNSLKKEITNGARQVEAFLDVQQYLQTGGFLGGMHGWPVSPDFALCIIELLEANEYDLVIEFGSGQSTVIIAKALARIAARKNAPTRQIAFEHLPQYHEDTLSKLRRNALEDAVEVVLAPLEFHAAASGDVFQYYECKQTLEQVGRDTEPRDCRILLLVDGPPGSTGKHARYPALPIALDHLRFSRMDVLLDDFNRPDEREVVESWEREISLRNLHSHTTTFDLEKGAALLRITSENALE